MRQRPHVVLLLGDGHAWATIVAVLYTSPTPIARWKRRFDQGGVDEVFGRKRGRPRTCVHVWASLVVRWVLTMSPVSFGFARSQWSCAAVVLWEDFRESVGRETVRLWLRSSGLVWRRPRPVIRPKDPDREKMLQALRALLHALPAEETSVLTRNHRCRTIDELLDLTFDWFATRSHFRV